MHFANKRAFDLLGEERSAKLLDELFPLIIETAIDTIWKGHTYESRGKMKDKFISNLNIAESEYFQCTEMVANGDISAVILSGFTKPRIGLINQLGDNLCNAITGEKGVSLDLTFNMLIKEKVMNLLKEIEKLIMKY